MIPEFFCGLLLQTAALAAAPRRALPAGAVERLSQAIRFQTVSHQDPSRFPAAEFVGLREHIERSYPRIHRELKRELVNGHTLLYTWPGREPATRPVLLMGHLDVVPVEPGTESRWTYPAFSGAVADGFIWGRGAIDDKGRALSVLEAIELLLAEGFSPRRTIYVSLGHDEEVGGYQGAAKVAELMQRRNISPEAVYDEGGSLVSGVLPGLKTPIARLMVAEKGYLTIALNAEATGGHSSIPPARTAIGALAAALVRLQSDPFPARLTPLVEEGLKQIAPELQPPLREWFADPQRHWPEISALLAKEPATNALTRTTLAPTIISGGIKDNVLPANAVALVNLRLLQGDGTTDALERVRRVVADPKISLRTLGFLAEPSPVADSSAWPYRAIAATIRQILPEALVWPALLPGATDARHFAALTPHILRFRPWRAVTPEELSRFHGTNERIGLDHLDEYIRFQVALIRNLEAFR